MNNIEINDISNLKNNGSKNSLLTKTKKRLLNTVRSQHLTYIEVFGLMRVEEGLDLYPLDMYQGVIKGNIYYKKKIPLMKRLKYVGYNHGIAKWRNGTFASGKDAKRANKKHAGQGIIEKAKKRGYILDAEIKGLKKLGFTMMIEEVPAIFVVAKISLKSNQDAEIQEHSSSKSHREPIVLIKHGEDDFECVHTRDESAISNEELINAMK